MLINYTIYMKTLYNDPAIQALAASILEAGKNGRKRPAKRKKLNSEKNYIIPLCKRQKPKKRKTYTRKPKYNYPSYVISKYDRLVQSADKRHKSFDLSCIEFCDWYLNTSQHCEYCGITMPELHKMLEYLKATEHIPEVLIGIKTRYSNIHYSSHFTIDRVDNTQGYNLSNIVKSCWICNSIKSNVMTYEEASLVMRPLMKRILSYIPIMEL